MIRNLSVRYKVTAIAVITATAVILLASALFVALEIHNYRRGLAQELTAIAQITASNSTAAILFNDKTAARETLGALGARPNIEAAALYARDGRMFAYYSAGAAGDRTNPAVPTTTGMSGQHSLPAGWAVESHGDGEAYKLAWSDHSVDLYGPVWLDDELIGAIRIRSNLNQINATIAIYLSVAAMIVLLAIALAWLLASLLRRQVTEPIFGLLDTIQAVARNRDYAQRAPKQGNDEMGALVDGVNAMLAETEAHRIELSAARQQAESANRLKSDFLAQMSHELRTPLNAILGFSDFMLSEPHGPLGHANYREYMHDINEGGQHLLAVINDILDLSKIEAGAAKLHEEVLDPDILISDAARLLRERAAKAEIELLAEVTPGLPHLFGDANLLKRGLLNLLSNALKFTPSGGRITVRADEAPDGAIILTVIDNGVGIAPHQIEHVLSPFGQVENVMTRSQDGTGLGLPLVKSFVELHGGTLDLRSALGEGTMVSMQFPPSRTRARPVVDDTIASTNLAVAETVPNLSLIA